jgi:hypothetical protein
MSARPYKLVAKQAITTFHLASGIQTLQRAKMRAAALSNRTSFIVEVEHETEGVVCKFEKGNEVKP